MNQTERGGREALLEQILDSAPDPMVIVDAGGKIQLANSQLQATFGYTREELIDQPVEILVPKRLATQHAHHREAYGSDPQPREMGSGLELCGQTKDGREIPIEVSLAPVQSHGQLLVSAALRDITERKRVRDALQISEQRFKDFADTAADWFWEMDADLRFMFLSERFEEVTGRSPDEILGKTRKELFQQASIDEAKWRTHAKALKGRRPFQNFDYELVRPDGQRRIVNVSGKPIFDMHGNFQGYRGVAQDVTPQKELEQALKESHKTLEERVAERTRDLERQQEELRQAQKMETLGQLTGGVAHDFNNLLTAIMGNLEMLEAWHGDDERSQKAISQAQEAADLGAELTGRLLAFARRQPLDPKVIAVNDIVLQMGELLARTLGETIEINTVLANPLHQTLVDSTQVRNALLNLAINARDAMPNGGQLTLETANVELDEDYAKNHPDVTAGDFVMLSVSDTGTGMAPEIRDRVFEPFFTTKDVGRGSGLGLSMVYGFIKQSGGHVRLYSEVGHGTTISAYLPKIQAPASAVDQPKTTAEIPNARRETVLVVEDDPQVRQVTVQRFQTLGYTVLEADRGQAAIDLLNESPRIDLVFTDVVMPGGMSGADLAREVRRLYPEIKVLLTSGYSEHAGIENGAPEDRSLWLRKPYRMAELAQKVRNVLDG